MTTSLINYGDQSKTVALANAKFGMTGVRLQTGKEFKDANGLKGAEGKRRYAEYKLEHGKANTGQLAAAMAEGKVIVTGFKQYSKTGKMNVSFEEVERVKKDTVVKLPAAPAKPVDITELLANMDATARAAVISQYLTAKSA